MKMPAHQALSTATLSVRLGGRTVVDGVSFALDPGQFVALVGPNGAGKTSLLRALAGLIPATGTIRLGDTPLDRLTLKERARCMAYLPQGHEVHWPLLVRDVVALGRYPHGVADPARLGLADEAIVADALRRCDATAFAEREIQTLSGGERARVMMARVFAVESPVLLADEPTAALDPRHQLMAMQALKAEAGRGALVIAITHDLTLAARMADRIMVMSEGRLVANGRPRDVLSQALLADVYGIQAAIIDHEGEMLLQPWGLHEAER